MPPPMTITEGDLPRCLSTFAQQRSTREEGGILVHFSIYNEIDANFRKKKKKKKNKTKKKKKKKKDNSQMHKIDTSNAQFDFLHSYFGGKTQPVVCLPNHTQYSALKTPVRS